MPGWTLGKVALEKEHFQITCGEDPLVRALVGNTLGVITVEFTEPKPPPDLQKSISEELDFYLTELNEPDPWGYLIYHTGTAANVYSSVHFAFVPQV